MDALGSAPPGAFSFSGAGNQVQKMKDICLPVCRLMKDMGFYQREIAECYGVSRDVVQYRLSSKCKSEKSISRSINIRKAPNCNRYARTCRAIVHMLFDFGFTELEISDFSQTSRSYVYAVLVSRGCINKCNRRKRSKFLESEVLRLNRIGMNDSQIAREINADQSTVSGVRRRLNLPTRHETNEERHAKAVAFYGSEEEFRRHKNKRQWKGQKERYRMKCEQHGVEYDESVNLQDLVKRDGVICSICGIECSFTDKRWGNFGPTYPTMDHIIPLSKGGSHTWDNVQIACGECNCHVKRDKLEVVA